MTRPDLHMRQTPAGRLLADRYPALPRRAALLRRVVAREGGEMFSLTLRRVLEEQFGVTVGAYSYGGLLVLGAADRGTVIGRYVSVGANVRRFGAAHPLDSLTMHPFWYNPRLGFVLPERDVPRTGIEIGHDSWIGANVTILPRVAYIGIGAVVGAGSVVTRDVPDFAIAVGNPARVVAERLTSEQRTAVMRDRPWLLEPAEADRYYDARARHPG